MKLGQGRDNAKETLESNPEIMKEIEQKILENSEQLVMLSKKNKKKAENTASAKAMAAKAEEPLTENPSAINKDLPIANADEDFEEFTPAESDK
jgi:recombination protein RecA